MVREKQNISLEWHVLKRGWNQKEKFALNGKRTEHRKLAFFLHFGCFAAVLISFCWKWAVGRRWKKFSSLYRHSNIETKSFFNYFYGPQHDVLQPPHPFASSRHEKFLFEGLVHCFYYWLVEEKFIEPEFVVTVWWVRLVCCKHLSWCSNSRQLKFSKALYGSPHLKSISLKFAWFNRSIHHNSHNFLCQNWADRILRKMA